jgi:hypothetical protein
MTKASEDLLIAFHNHDKKLLPTYVVSFNNVMLCLEPYPLYLVAVYLAMPSVTQTA